ncbi:MAG TPA: hypothetical protein VGZ90_10725 [Puia sp.]|jgi:hypothetical protein|nr:hypothetical protein [Puia sp.]
MNFEQYSIISDSSFLSYKFESVGPKGVIKKYVYYRKIHMINEITYNLSFGDWDELTGGINDLVISNNNDTTKILFTVYQTVLLFTSHFPNANVLIVGSTNSRTRLYQMAIGRNFIEIEKNFDIQGFKYGSWELFKHGINFDAFLAKKKINKS